MAEAIGGGGELPNTLDPLYSGNNPFPLLCSFQSYPIPTTSTQHAKHGSRPQSIPFTYCEPANGVDRLPGPPVGPARHSVCLRCAKPCQDMTCSIPQCNPQSLCPPHHCPSLDQGLPGRSEPLRNIKKPKRIFLPQIQTYHWSEERMYIWPNSTKIL